MNYLAHLFLASDQDDARIGGLLGDFVKGKDKERYSQAIQREIQIHILIDSYTDDHPVVREMRRMVVEKKRRYMGIVLDIFYDHALAVKWDIYSKVELSEFVEESYRLLEQNKAILPRDLAGMLPYMVHHDWLASYKEFDGFKRGMYRVSRMLRKGNILLECISDVETHYELFLSSFDEFFPQLVAHVQEQRRHLTADSNT